MMGVTTTTVARWARDGYLKPVAYTPGGHRRYARAEVLALLEAASVAETDPEQQRLEADAVRLYVQGWSIRRVASEFGWNYGKMRRILLKHTVLRDRDGSEPQTPGC